MKKLERGTDCSQTITPMETKFLTRPLCFKRLISLETFKNGLKLARPIIAHEVAETGYLFGPTIIRKTYGYENIYLFHYLSMKLSV